MATEGGVQLVDMAECPLRQSGFCGKANCYMVARTRALKAAMDECDCWEVGEDAHRRDFE